MEKNIVTDFVCEWPPLVFNTIDFFSFSSAAKTLPDKEHKCNLGKGCEAKILCVCVLVCVCARERVCV